MRKSRKQIPPKRKQFKRQIPTVEDYVRKLPKNRLIEIVLDQVADNEALERELLDEILERFGGAIEHASRASLSPAFRVRRFRVQRIARANLVEVPKKRQWDSPVTI